MSCPRTDCPNNGISHITPCPVCENFSSFDSPYPKEIRIGPTQLDRIEAKLDKLLGIDVEIGNSTNPVPLNT